MPVTPPICVHASGRTARHEAAFTWVLSSALGLDWSWADAGTAEGLDDGCIHCHYGAGEAGHGIALPVEGLLSEVGQWRAEPPEVEGADADLFAAVFWMASRMEEHVSGAVRDDHGRFDPSGSIPEIMGWLDVPVCEQWAFRIGERLLGEHWPAHQAKLQAQFEVRPTIDVDSAYAFLGKGVVRTGGALLRDLTRGRFSNVARRVRVLLERAPDPYDTYFTAQKWHRDRGLQAQWFFLLAAFGSHDKGLPPSSPRLGALMRALEEAPDQEVHWHPGYASASDAMTMQREFDAFQRILGRAPAASRQHYLRMEPTATRRALIAMGIQEDHTEGHAVRTGFRGGFSRRRPWYDLEAECLTNLMLCPFAAMDATYLRYLATAPDAVPDAVRTLSDAVQSVGGTLRLLWHNESLAPEGQWSGWGGVYPAVLDAAMEGTGQHHSASRSFVD